MPRIPAICDKCETVYLSKVQVKDCTCHIQGHVEGPCVCGGKIRILDGTYSHLGGALNYCRASGENQAKFGQMCELCGVELYQPSA